MTENNGNVEGKVSFGVPKRKEKPTVIQVFSNNLASLCLQVENSSDLWFRVAPEGWKIIWNFSLRHNMRFSLLGQIRKQF